MESEGSADLLAFLASLVGISHLTTDNVTHNSIQFEGHYLQSFRWLLPWATDGFLKSNYVQLDASFHALHPYVYCIPLAIIRNHPVLLGLFVERSENKIMYSNFFSSLMSLEIPIDLIREKPILSDQGRAIIAAVAEVGAFHFFCFRHLIEKLGGRTILAAMARRLLYLPSQSQYIESLPQTLSDLHALAQNNLIDVTDVVKICDIFDWQYSDGVIIPREDGLFTQAIWFRGPMSVSTCSNHIERLHRTLNESVGDVKIIRKKAGWRKSF